MKNFIGCILTALLMLAAFVSCSTPQNVEYFQNSSQLSGMLLQPEQQFRLRPEDKINIVVSSADPALEQQFTLTVMNRNVLGSTVSPQAVSGRETTATGMPIAYTVDAQGDITFPELGKVAVAGKTRNEVAAYIADRLKARHLVNDPIVTVEYVNIGVDVLGEVGKPGRVDISGDHFTLLNALSKAGDLTINGKREDVMVARVVDGQNLVYHVNLCDMQDVLNSPAYYLQQEDVVYVSPSQKRKREYKSSGNTFQNPSIWISIASLLTTITALLVK